MTSGRASLFCSHPEATHFRQRTPNLGADILAPSATTTPSSAHARGARRRRRLFPAQRHQASAAPSPLPPSPPTKRISGNGDIRQLLSRRAHGCAARARVEASVRATAEPGGGGVCQCPFPCRFPCPCGARGPREAGVQDWRRGGEEDDERDEDGKGDGDGKGARERVYQARDRGRRRGAARRGKNPGRGDGHLPAGRARGGVRRRAVCFAPRRRVPGTAWRTVLATSPRAR